MRSCVCIVSNHFCFPRKPSLSFCVKKSTSTAVMPRVQYSTNNVLQQQSYRTPSRSNSLTSAEQPSVSETLKAWQNADAVCFDVDSTVIVDEGLDELANFCNKGDIIKKITKEAMKGGVEFREALQARLNILKPTSEAIQNFNIAHPPRLTPGISELVSQLHARQVDVYLVSGGFRSLIVPVARRLDIPLENIYANRLKFYYDGEYAGFDENEPTSRSGGKAEVISLLKEKQGYSTIVMVGDGATDLEACPPANSFIGFGGNVVREAVKSKASLFVTNFQTLIDQLNESS